MPRQNTKLDAPPCNTTSLASRSNVIRNASYRTYGSEFIIIIVSYGLSYPTLGRFVLGNVQSRVQCPSYPYRRHVRNCRSMWSSVVIFAFSPLFSLCDEFCVCSSHVLPLNLPFLSHVLQTDAIEIKDDEGTKSADKNTSSYLSTSCRHDPD